QKNVSSVLFNRLKAKMKLQCDPTITYVEGAIKPFITGDKNRFNTAYNTYKCPALPAGPICNPGLSAILAALNPAKTDFLYFAMDKNNTHYYAKTLAQHNENCKKGNINTGIG
ncbi:MAG: endolytic transglycosylase MltG, partial [Oscillospiraceae bacterium]